MTTQLLYPEITYKILGSAFKVFNQLGFGHKEKIYQKALAIEFDKNRIKYKREPRVDVKYDNEKVIVELKAMKFFPPELDKQLVNYLKVTGFEIAIAINFGQEKIDIRRRIWTRKSV